MQRLSHRNKVAPFHVEYDARDICLLNEGCERSATAHAQKGGRKLAPTAASLPASSTRGLAGKFVNTQPPKPAFFLPQAGAARAPSKV